MYKEALKCVQGPLESQGPLLEILGQPGWQLNAISLRMWCRVRNFQTTLMVFKEL